MRDIEPHLDFASYYHEGGDPDRTCERLYRWHQSLCSRPVEGVGPFNIDVTYDGAYELTLSTTEGSTFRLGSDGIIPTWSTSGWTNQFSPELVVEVGRDADDFFRIASTIGGYVLFPRNGEGQTGSTINQARGVHPQIADRFDLTLECIRRHYLDPSMESPLAHRLNYYGDFFAPFGDFDTYVRFFLLDDLITPRPQRRQVADHRGARDRVPLPRVRHRPHGVRALPTQQHHVRQCTERPHPATRLLKQPRRG